MVTVKVCGLTNREDFLVAADAGADFLGVIFQPESPRFVMDAGWVAEARQSCPHAKTVAVFSRRVQQYPLETFDIVQCSDPELGSKEAVFKVVRPRSDWRLEDWLGAAAGWPTVLVDPFHEGMGGGTGLRLDWGLAAEFVAAFTGKVALAGGLNPANVALAIEKVRPWAVDACSGLEVSPGKKDQSLVREFVFAVKGL